MFFTAGCSTSSDSNNNTEVTLPVVTTNSVTAITTTTAVSGGIISSDGGAPVTARGVVWGTNPTPTIALATKTTDGAGTGSFVSVITALTNNTTYHTRAYATNSSGTAYGNEITFTTTNVSGNTVTDIDGNTYQPVTICNQTWIKTNLNVSKYRNGDVIPQVTTQTAWSNLTTGAWCYYNNDPANGATYGKIYNWYAVNDPRGLAPAGWHIPTDAEWTTLTDCLGGEALAGGKMKETGTTHWTSPNANASNSSGFTGLPGGWRTSTGTFSNIGTHGYWHSETTTFNTFYVWSRYLNCNFGDVGRYEDTKGQGTYVRCLKN